MPAQGNRELGLDVVIFRLKNTVNQYKWYSLNLMNKLDSCSRLILDYI